jgi:hypothetical protein
MCIFVVESMCTFPRIGRVGSSSVGVFSAGLMLLRSLHTVRFCMVLLEIPETGRNRDHPNRIR